MLSIEYVYVQAGQAFIPYDAIARVLAGATHPPGEDGDSGVLHELHADQWEKRLSSAVQTGELVRRDCVTGMPTPYAGQIVSVEDLAAWLDGNGSNVRLKVIEPDGHGQTDTPKQRRARLLDMFEVEKKKGIRGALSRLAAREGVDRSNLGKAIKNAKEEREAAVRDGVLSKACTSHLVLCGKRKG